MLVVGWLYVVVCCSVLFCVFYVFLCCSVLFCVVCSVVCVLCLWAGGHVVRTFSMMKTRRDHRNLTKDDLGNRKNQTRKGKKA